MKLSQLEKVNKYVLEIKKIDTELEVINSIAEQFVNNNCKIELSVENLDKAASKKSEGSLDEDNSLIFNENSLSPHRFMFMNMEDFFQMKGMPKNKPVSNVVKHKWDVSEVTGLLVLEILKQERQVRKEAILKTLKRYKIEL